MGRVARYKRIKAIDPFAKKVTQPRKKGGLLPGQAPSKHKKRNKSHGSDTFTVDDVMDRDGDTGESMGNKATGVTKSMHLKDALRHVQRGKRERLGDFYKRVDAAASGVIAQGARQATKTAERSRDHLKERKQKRQPRSAGGMADEDVDDELRLYGKEKIAFGEVADAPPVLTAVPRKAKKLAPKAQRQTASLLLAQKTTDQRKASKVAPVRQQALDQERERAIKAYRMLKRNRDTHAFG
ncbi:uncharacterized protein MONBRDRAFT_24540 [Monosiga brevicollis MX1]|uniref:Uncharacterized protein n=1 Tax=Monosiga brevicollis TaxID=81824 RepID=A9UWR4_MONBE|nr:uncharacterized protein MONBRDRAFT_24540 [Monosiga brevicollis MX1]EDQ90089.1 predicted protein [Monosiga brevicollis MX1]|eukprot:XP_001744856.1 hypothetical protein [Monosiga brevicollis MX1]